MMQDRPALLEKYKDKIRDYIQKDVTSALQPERMATLAKIARSNRYWVGDHYAVPNARNGGLEWSSMTGNMISNSKDAGNRGVYDNVWNYYQGDGKKLVGVLGKVPNAKSVPNDPENDLAHTVARKQDRIINELRSHWAVEQLQSELVLKMWKMPLAYMYTPFVTSKPRYGVTKTPQVEMRMRQLGGNEYQCFNCGSITDANSVQMLGMRCPNPQCGAPLGPESYIDPIVQEFPEVVGETEWANGSVELTLCDPNTVSHSYRIKKLEEAPVLVYEYDTFPGTLISEYEQLRDPDIRRKVENSVRDILSPASEQASINRSIAASSLKYGTISTLYNMWRYTRVWMEPAAILMLGTAEDAQMQDELLSEFPNGMKLTAIQGVPIMLEAESHREVWTACKPSVSDYIFSEPLGETKIRLNDVINDCGNMMVQKQERGLPITGIDPTIIDPKALTESRPVGVEFFPMLPGIGKSLRDSMYTISPTEWKGTEPQLADWILNASREIDGVTPQLTGMGAVSQTLGESELKHNAALLPHNTAWSNMRQAWAEAYDKASVQFAKHSDGKLFFRSATNAFMPPRQVEIENIQDLLLGMTHVECDEAIPMTWGQKRSQVFQLFQLPTGPATAPLSDPENIGILYESIGLPELNIPIMDQRDKTMAMIKTLLRAAPIQQLDQMTGQPMLVPSIPPDEIDDAPSVIKFIQDWALSSDGQLNAQNNAIGYSNVLASWKAYKVLAAPPPLPPGPGGNQGGPPPASQGGPPPPDHVPVGAAPPGNANLQLQPSQPPSPGGLVEDGMPNQ